MNFVYSCFAVLVKWHSLHSPSSQDQKQEPPWSPPFLTSSSSYSINYHIRLFLSPKHLLSLSSPLYYTGLPFGPPLSLAQMITMSTCFEPILHTAARVIFLKHKSYQWKVLQKLDQSISCTGGSKALGFPGQTIFFLSKYIAFIKDSYKPSILLWLPLQKRKTYFHCKNMDI